MNIKEAMQAISLDLIELQTQVPGQTDPAYYKPVTLELEDKVASMCAAKGTDSAGYKLACSIVLTLRTKTGELIFGPGDQGWLMRDIPRDILLDIVNEISGAVPTLEEAEKN